MPIPDREEIYVVAHQTKLAVLNAMWEDPKVQLYNDAEFPDNMNEKFVFLAGPTSRNQILEYQWRAQAVSLLRHYGFTGWIFCPEPRGHEAPGDFTERSYIHKWESERLMNATHVVFWVPRKADELLGLNTNLELGIFLGFAISENLDGQKLFVGWPHEAERMGLPNHYMEMGKVYRYTTLEELCQETVRSMR